MIVEWILHGRYHRGFRWIIYYASSVIALSVIIWTACLISAIRYSKKSSISEDQVLDKSEEDGRIEEAMAVDDHSVGGFELECGESLISMDKWMGPRRSVTLPLKSDVAHDETNVKRRWSFC